MSRRHRLHSHGTRLAVGALAFIAACASGCSSPASEHAGLVFTRYSGAQHPSIWVANADGSRARPLSRDGYAARLAPDGRSVAYATAHEGPENIPDVFVREVGGGRRRSVGRAREYVWSPDGKRLAIDTGTSLVLVDVNSGRRQRLASGDVTYFDFAPNGKTLVFARGNGRAGHRYRSDLFLVRVSDHRSRQLTHDRHSDHPVWGRGWIVYRRFSFAGDRSIGTLYLVRPDGRNGRELGRGDEAASRGQMGLEPVELSDDGKHLLGCAAAEFGCSPVTFMVPGGRRYELRLGGEHGILRAGELTWAADISRDGRQVLVDVGSFDGVDNHRVYGVPFQGGRPQIIARDATVPSWAP